MRPRDQRPAGGALNPRCCHPRPVPRRCASRESALTPRAHSTRASGQTRAVTLKEAMRRVRVHRPARTAAETLAGGGIPGAPKALCVTRASFTRRLLLTSPSLPSQCRHARRHVFMMFPVEFVTHFRGSPNPAKPAARRASARLRWPVRPVRARAVRAVRTTALCVGAAHDCVPVLCARCARAVCRRHVRARAHACCACPCCACSSCAPSCWACGALVQRSSRSCFARQCRRPRGCAGPCFVLVLCMLALCCPWGSS